MRKKFLLGLTTTLRSNWKRKIIEIDKFGIKEVAFFPTFINDIEERKKIYALLEKTGLEKIPHVHLNDNVSEWEMDYYVSRFQTFLFNIHSNEKTEKLLEKTKYRNIIYVETTDNIDELFMKNLNCSAGLCLDVSHISDKGFYQYCEGYEKIPDLLKNYKVGCAHVSALREEPEEYIHYITGKKMLNWSSHWLDDLSQLDYVKKYLRYLPEYVSIELENPFEDQIKVKAYLEKMIG